jgi:solute carrier family 25 phosphate transporter 23/24/25/41
MPLEFRTFVEQTEQELLSLFQSIDRDHNGKLDKSELQAAFKRAGMVVPGTKLNQFFSEVDENHDVCSYSTLKTLNTNAN